MKKLAFLKVVLANTTLKRESVTTTAKHKRTLSLLQIARYHARPSGDRKGAWELVVVTPSLFFLPLACRRVSPLGHACYFVITRSMIESFMMAVDFM